MNTFKKILDELLEKDFSDPGTAGFFTGLAAGINAKNKRTSAARAKTAARTPDDISNKKLQIINNKIKKLEQVAGTRRKKASSLEAEAAKMDKEIEKLKSQLV